MMLGLYLYAELAFIQTQSNRSIAQRYYLKVRICHIYHSVSLAARHYFALSCGGRREIESCNYCQLHTSAQPMKSLPTQITLAIITPIYMQLLCGHLLTVPTLFLVHSSSLCFTSCMVPAVLNDCFKVAASSVIFRVSLKNLWMSSHL